jgi:hypothetical protein
LEEVDSIFLNSKSIFDTVSIAKKIPRGQAVRHLMEKAETYDAEHEEVARNADGNEISAQSEAI